LWSGSFKVVKDLSPHDEVLGLAATLPIALGAFGAAVRIYIPAR